MVKIGFSKKSAQASANHNIQKKLATEVQVAISERKHQFLEQEVSSPPLCGACHCGVTFSRSDEDSTTPPTHNLIVDKFDEWGNYNWWFGSRRDSIINNNNKKMYAHNGSEHDYEEEDREPSLTSQREDNCAASQRNIIRRKQLPFKKPTSASKENYRKSKLMNVKDEDGGRTGVGGEEETTLPFKKPTSASKENYRKSKLMNVKDEDGGRTGVGGEEETTLFNPLSSRIRIVGGPTLPRHHNRKDTNTDEIESVCLGNDRGIYNHSAVPQNKFFVHSLKKKRRNAT
eukprot:CAMPEP_0172435070 /NCGR_PEP_ID=MMETSP1064-20121228/70978_1 /TAXON_ID=202472 /ORGANISM="Aulacoseira subarctica , Strain CCAP 1002/5" /LENGTH=286 /DNA_ID=CAMNT_0013183349 /DNA_START=134 /DNA_END=994 /DNA_ORIENTATION=-